MGTLRSDDSDDNENVIRAIGLKSKTTTLHVYHTFLYTVICRFSTTATWKKPNFMFCRGRKGDVAWDDLQRRFLAQHVQRYNLVATSFERLQRCSNIWIPCCVKNRRCESSRVTSCILKIKEATTKFSFSFLTWIRLLGIQLQEMSRTFDKACKRNGINSMKIEKPRIHF